MINILTVTKKQFAIFFFTLTILFITAIILVWLYAPAVPKKITIASGASGGVFDQFAKEFKKSFEQSSGIEVEIRQTGGSVENIKLLSSPNSNVDLALTVTGNPLAKDYPSLVSIAAVTYAPLWVWYRPSVFNGELKYLSQLKGKRFAVGPSGSGTEQLSKLLLGLNEIQENEISLLNLKFIESATQLINGKVDVIALVDSINSPIIEKLGNDNSVRLMNFSQAAAYSRSVPGILNIPLPDSNISFKNHIPDKDINLISTKAVLTSRSDINPALVNEIMAVLYKNNFRNYSRLQNLDEFPNNQGLDFPQQEDAEIYMKDGPTFLYKHLPAWLAVWVGRILAIIIPLAILIVPLRTIVPALIQAPLRFNMGKSYLEMKQLELDVHNAEMNNLPLSDFELLSKRLDVFEVKVNKLKVPAFETEQYFNLKAHIDV
ncbi:MAG: TAXI family TRAP transporter solute-binding subunit, partial [Betaproteobacteria bacterium]